MVVGGIEDVKVKVGFVNREKEFGELKRLLHEATSGKGNLVLVSGEAGIGKTRIVQELGKYGESKGVRFLKGRCLYHENSDPYLPFIDALREYFQTREVGTKEKEETYIPMGLLAAPDAGDIDAEVTPERGVEDLLPMGLLPMTEGKKDIREEAVEVEQPKINILEERERMFENLAQLVINISNEKPLLLFIDDLQWADSASLQLLHYIARSIRNSRVLICGAYRPEELEEREGKRHPLTLALQRLNTEKLSTTVTLHRLQLKDIGTMVRDMLDIENVPESFIRLLYEESEGNPFFVEEVVKSLIEEGVLSTQTYVWDFDIDISKIRIPDTIKDVMSRRIQGLDENSKKVIMFAAVVGHKFDFDTLHKVTEMREDGLLDAIDKLIEAKLIKEDHRSKKEEYVFDHVQVRSVVYDSMSKSRSRVMHKKVGDIIEEMNKENIDDVVYVLARHFNTGKDPEKSYKYSLRAGDKAAKLYATEDAVRYYEWALGALQDMEKTTENKRKMLELLSKLGDMQNSVSNFKESIETYKSLQRLADDLGDRIKSAETFKKLGDGMRQLGDFTEAFKYFETSLKVFKALGEFRGIADAEGGLGYIHWRRGEHDEAINHYNTALEYATRIGAIPIIARTFIEIGNVYNYKGELDKGIDYYKRSLEHLEKLEDYGQIARAYNNLGDVYLRKKDWDKAIEYFDKCRKVAEKVGNKMFVGWSYFNSSEAYARKGDLKMARDVADKALRVLEKIGDKIGMQGLYRNYGIICRVEKKWDEAEKWFRESLKILEELNMPFDQAANRFEFAIMYREKGDKVQAIVLLKEAEKIFEDIGSTEDLQKVRNEIRVLELSS